MQVCVTVQYLFDSNKAHVMSQTLKSNHLKLNLPVILEYREMPGSMRLVPPAREYRRWGPSPQYEFIYDRSGQLMEASEFDPWKLRDLFLSFSPGEWEGFILLAGRFGGIRQNEANFAKWQALIREAVVQPVREWKKLESRFGKGKVRGLFRPLHIQFEWDSDAPIARVVLVESLEAIIASIQFDKLQGAEFRHCARGDCEAPPFRLGSRSEKIYCSYECAHLVYMRKKREAEKKRQEKRLKKGRKQIREG